MRAMSWLPWSSASVCGVQPSARRRNGSAPCCDEQLDHRHVPSSRGDVQRRFAVVAPREVRIRAVLEQPARAGGIGGPEHHVDERRHAAGNPVHVDAEAMQQLERGEIAAAAGDVDVTRRRWDSRPPRAAPPRAAGG